MRMSSRKGETSRIHGKDWHNEHVVRKEERNWRSSTVEHGALTTQKGGTFFFNGFRVIVIVIIVESSNRRTAFLLCDVGRWRLVRSRSVSDPRSLVAIQGTGQTRFDSESRNVCTHSVVHRKSRGKHSSLIRLLSNGYGLLVSYRTLYAPAL